MNDETLQALANKLRRTVRGDFLDLCDGVLRLLSEKRVKMKSDDGCPACAARRAADTARVQRHRAKRRA